MSIGHLTFMFLFCFVFLLQKTFISIWYMGILCIKKCLVMSNICCQKRITIEFFEILYRSWILILISCMICKCFLPFYHLSFFALLSISFVVQKLLTLMQSYLSTFAFIFCASGVFFRKFLTVLIAYTVSTMFFFSNHVIDSSVHFDLIFS